MQAELLLLSIFLVLLVGTMITINNTKDSYLGADHNRGERRYSLREFLIEKLHRHSRGESSAYRRTW